MKKRIIIVLFVFVLTLILLATYLSYIDQGIVYAIAVNDMDSIIANIQSFGNLAAIALVVLVTLEAVIAPLPPFVFYVAAGILFGAFTGGLLVLLGNLLGAALAFILARTLAREYIEKRINQKNRKTFSNFSEKYGAFAIFFLRINPLTSSDIFSYAAGLTKMKLSRFLLGTALGLAPLIFLQTYLGADMIKDNPLLMLIFIYISIAYVLAFIGLMIYFVLKKRKRQR